MARMRLALDVGAKNLRAKSESTIVTEQVNVDCQTRDPQLLKYQDIANERKKKFESFELVRVSREHNSRVDLLAKLASIKKPGNNRSVIQEIISHLSIDDLKVCTIT